MYITLQVFWLLFFKKVTSSLNRAALPERGWRRARFPMEQPRQVFLVGEAAGEGDFRDGHFGSSQQAGGMGDALLQQIAVGRGAGGAFEAAGEGGEGRAGDGGQVVQADRVGEMGVDVVFHPRQLGLAEGWGGGLWRGLVAGEQAGGQGAGEVVGHQAGRGILAGHGVVGGAG